MDDDLARQTPDDALEPADDIFNPDLDEERLAEDNDPPATPADDVPGPHLPPDHPAFDTDIEPNELYGEGEDQAADMNDRQFGPDEQARPLEPEDE